MSLFKLKLVIITTTFFLGIIGVGVWFTLSKQRIVDPTIYSVDFCELIKNPNQYDGKIVRLQAIYSLGTERTDITGFTCGGEIRFNLPSNEEENQHARAQIDALSKVRRSPEYRLKVDVVGRFTASVTDSDPPLDGKFFHPNIKLFETLELKGVEIIKLY